MKVVILAGGLGTRIREESQFIPKPMIDIGGRPILWHIMKIYSYYGFNEFVICAGYKQHVIKEFFAKHSLYNSDVTFDFTNGGKIEVHNDFSEPWKVTVVNTGYETNTAGRIMRVRSYLNEERFMLTYGDGVSDVDIRALLEFHKSHGKICTLTSVHPAMQFGMIEFNGDQVIAFREKTRKDVVSINGGFMVLEPGVFDYIGGDYMFENEPMNQLVAAGEVMAYKHEGFWKCMDTIRDKRTLESLWNSGRAPWKLWE